MTNIDAEMLTLLLFLLMFPVVFALYLSPWWVRLMWPRIRYAFAAKETTPAKLLELHEGRGLRTSHGWLRWNDEEYFCSHFAIFKAADGKQHTMVITKAQYQEMVQGTTGTLCRKGKCFVSFTRDQ